MYQCARPLAKSSPFVKLSGVQYSVPPKPLDQNHSTDEIESSRSDLHNLKIVTDRIAPASLPYKYLEESQEATVHQSFVHKKNPDDLSNLIPSAPSWILEQ